MLIASRIALLEYQVYRPLADDRGVDLLPWTVLALVVYGDSLEEQPLVYFVPAISWRSPRPPMTSYDYVGGKSAPEYGLNVRKAWRAELEEWSADADHIHRLMQQAHTEPA